MKATILQYQALGILAYLIVGLLPMRALAQTSDLNQPTLIVSSGYPTLYATAGDVGNASATEPTPTSGLAFKLNPPLPNPVTHSTHISFDIPTACKVMLAVYDVSGNLIVVIHKSLLEAGSHSITWTPEDTMPGGVYYLALKTPQDTEYLRLNVM